MTKIKIVAISDLITDQRIQKTARSLINAGYEVELIGRKSLKKGPYAIPGLKCHWISIFFKRGPLFYAEFNVRVFFHLLFTRKPDLYFSVDLDTLLPTYLIHRIVRNNLVYDSHEFFTELPEIVGRPHVQKVWQFLEKQLLTRVSHASTVCQSIADEYKTLYGINMQVVRNTPVLNFGEECEFTPSLPDKFIIYQGVINLGRGLELMIKTLKRLPENIHFVVAGAGYHEENIKKLVAENNLTSRVHFIGRIDPCNLRNITRKAIVGLSLEEDLGKNYHYALPNKLFDYIHAEIPVIVSDLPEMKKIVNEYRVGKVLTNRTTENLSELIMTIHDSRESFAENLTNAKLELNWEKEEKTLIKLVEAALQEHEQE